MSFFDFFQRVGDCIGDIHKLNKELVEDINDILKECKTDLKEVVHDHHPKTGEVIENVDRFFQTASNGHKRNLPSKRAEKARKYDEDTLELGEHLIVDRLGYTHHGLYIGNNRVLHYSSNRIIEIDSLYSFIESGKNIRIIDSPRNYSSNEVIGRGYSRLGEADYDLVFNNCEHFVNWCRSGGKWSNSI